MLARYAHGPPGVRSSAVIFKRILSVVTVADEVKKCNDPNLGKTFDCKEQRKEKEQRREKQCNPSLFSARNSQRKCQSVRGWI